MKRSTQHHKGINTLKAMVFMLTIVAGFYSSWASAGRCTSYDFQEVGNWVTESPQYNDIVRVRISESCEGGRAQHYVQLWKACWSNPNGCLWKATSVSRSYYGPGLQFSFKLGFGGHFGIAYTDTRDSDLLIMNMTYNWNGQPSYSKAYRLKRQ